MKKYILSALAGAVTMFALLVVIANARSSSRPEEYEHIDYVSTITQGAASYAVNRTAPIGARTMLVLSI